MNARFEEQLEKAPAQHSAIDRTTAAGQRSEAPAHNRREAMRLLTLNTLKCTRRDVQDGRLRLKATKVEVRENSVFDGVFLDRVLPSVDWPTLVEMARAVNVNLPETLDDSRVRGAL